jgi:hypothetical protein
MIVATMYIGIVFDWLADLTHLANYYKLESREGALIDIMLSITIMLDSKNTKRNQF